MTIPPESMLVGRCYLADRRERPQLWLLDVVYPDGRVDYRSRPLNPALKQDWRSRKTTAV